ncbi:MAG: hypothetical protein ABI389_06835 [Rhodanobacter sp.]
MDDVADAPHLIGFDVPSLAGSLPGAGGEMNVILHKEAPTRWKLFFERAVENADLLIREGNPIVQGNTIAIRVTAGNVGSMRIKITEFLLNLNARYQYEPAATPHHLR